MEPQGVWYKSKKGWVSAVLGVAYFVLDHWGRAETAHDIYAVLKPTAKFFPLISPWIPLVLFAVAVGFFEAERRKRPRQAAPSSRTSSPPLYFPPPVPATTAPTTTTGEPRKIVNVTPERLIGLFHAGHTSIQAGKLAEAFIGKWIIVSGPLGDVLGSTDQLRMVVFGDRLTSLYNVVNMIFYDKEQFSLLSTLKPGDHITIIGKIREVDADLTGESCTKWNERESTWRKSGSCQSRGTSQSKS